MSLVQTVWPLTGPTEDVFIGPSGKALTNPQKAKQRIEKSSGVKFRIHDIRRTTFGEPSPRS